MFFIQKLLWLFASFILVQNHSQPSCIKKLDKTTCVGFPRYFEFNYLPLPIPSSDSTDQFYESRDREFLIQPGVNKICPEINAEEYTENYQMANALSGETITLQHPPRGHASQRSSDVWIYMHPVPNMYPDNKQLNSSEFELVGQFPFDNCYGLSKEVSWANCTGTVKLPDNLESGIYSFWWRWDLNDIPYSDCFEINIMQNNSSNSTNDNLNNTTNNLNNTENFQMCKCMC